MKKKSRSLVGDRRGVSRRAARREPAGDLIGERRGVSPPVI
jgi:hypothetical protein